MAKSIRTLSGPKARKYLTDLVSGAPGVPAEAIDQVAAAIEQEVVVVKVRAAAKAAVAKPAKPHPMLPFAREDIAERPMPDVEAKSETADGGHDEAGDEADEIIETASGSPAAAPAPVKAFDPYAFSLVVVLTKEGPDALRDRLAEIAEADLKALAKAQHVSLAAGLGSAAELREAIVSGTERRIADRRAAAS